MQHGGLASVSQLDGQGVLRQVLDVAVVAQVHRHEPVDEILQLPDRLLPDRLCVENIGRELNRRADNLH